MRIGIVGGGQLGRMLALEGYPLGLRFRFLEPQDGPPVSGLGELVSGDYDDPEALRRFADGLDLVTYEFENVPVEAARALASTLPVRPPPEALRAAQDRALEKQAFESLGIPTAPYRLVHDEGSLEAGVGGVGLPAVLKTRRWGYDGKGQTLLEGHGDIAAAAERFGDRPLIVERFVPFRRELSLVGVRGTDGSVSFYPLVENEHRDGILRTTVAPAPVVSEELQARARGYVRSLMESLDYVGVLALELFQEGDRLLANEMAPRVHNSGHWTLDAGCTSQFENHLRAVAGLPLGPTEPRCHVVMLNLLGAVPPLETLLALPGVHVHLYDKEPRPGRKLGHVNVVGADPAEARARLEAVEALVDGE